MRMKPPRTLAAICLMALALFCRAQGRQRVDSLCGVWADTTVAFDHRLDVLASIYAYDSSFTEAKATALAVGSATPDTNTVVWKRQRAMATLARGNILNWLVRNEEAIIHTRAALSRFEQIHDQRGAAYARVVEGYVLLAQGRSDQAVLVEMPAIRYFRAVADTTGLMWGLFDLATAFDMQHDVEHAAQYYRQALDLARIKQPALASGLLIQVVDMYLLGHDTLRATMYMDSLRILLVREQDIDSRGALERFQGDLLLGQGKCMEALEQYELSMRHLLGRIDRNDLIAKMWSKKAQARLCAGSYASAEKDAREGLAFAERFNMKKEAMDNMRVLADALQGMGRAREALQCTQRYYALRDSLVDTRATSRIVGALLSEEHALREAHDSLTNALDKERGSAVAEAALSHSKAQRNVLLITAVLALLITALLVNRYRLKRRLQEEQLRTRLSRDLHDDIGSTLSSINILSSVARKKAEADHDPDAAASLAKISDRSQRLMRNMSDIVWSVDPKKDSIEDLLARMREFSASLFELKGIAHSFDQPAVIPAIGLSAETKNNIYLLFKEAVNNVAKHSQCTHVRVSTALEQNMLHLVVKDDGLGMDLGARTNGHGGNGLRNMRERAAEMRAQLHLVSAPGNGTTITLDVPLRG